MLAFFFFFFYWEGASFFFLYLKWSTFKQLFILYFLFWNFSDALDFDFLFDFFIRCCHFLFRCPYPFSWNFLFLISSAFQIFLFIHSFLILTPSLFIRFFICLSFIVLFLVLFFTWFTQQLNGLHFFIVFSFLKFCFFFPQDS